MTKKRYGVTLTDPFQKGLDELIKEGIFMTPQHAIREGLRLLFKRYKVKPFSHPVKEAED